MSSLLEPVLPDRLLHCFSHAQGTSAQLSNERRRFRASGQQIDVSGEGLKIIQFMGIDEALRARTIRDDGIKFVESNNKVVAEFPVEIIGGERNVVKEIEVLRFDLATILYERTKGDVVYIFNDQISLLR